VEFRKIKLFFGDCIRKEVLNGFTLFYSPNFLAVINKEGVFQAFLFEYEGCNGLSFPISGSLPFENVGELEIFAPFGFYSLGKNSHSKLIVGVVLRYRRENFLFGNTAGSKFFYIGSSLVTSSPD